MTQKVDLRKCWLVPSMVPSSFHSSTSIFLFGQKTTEKTSANSKVDEWVPLRNSKLVKGSDPRQQRSQRQHSQHWWCPLSSLLKHNLGVKLLRLTERLFSNKQNMKNKTLI